MTLCCYVQSRFDEAAVALKRELDYYSRVDNQGLLNKLVMGLVLVHLHRGDYVAADQAFQATLRWDFISEYLNLGLGLVLAKFFNVSILRK